jgi:hypothetical protein
MVFMNHNGEPLLFFATNPTITLKNTTEPEGLQRDIKIMIDIGFSDLEIDGDSLLDIKGPQHLMNGVKAARLSQNWFLSYGFPVPGSMVTSLMATVTNSIRRKANMVVDCIANIGVTMND